MGTVVPFASAWVAWLGSGLVLALWYYRARKSALALHAVTAPVSRPHPKPKSDTRPAVKHVPRPDAFGELQTLLDGPEQSAGRRPGD